LQSDASVKKISQHITKKLLTNGGHVHQDRKEFEKKWDDISVLVAMA